MKIQGGCHCGAVRFSAGVETPIELLDCNCSICAMSGYLHLIVPHERFTLLQGDEALSMYSFGTGSARHLFCKHCGIKSFYQPRSHPEAWSIAWRCLDPGHGLEPRIVAYDGKNWESAHAALEREID